MSDNFKNHRISFKNENLIATMKYDYMGRRFEKTVIVEGNIETSQKFMYDDYLQIEELNANNESIKSYLWDPTAGEATRPLMLTDHALEQSFFFAHDANKNVVDLIDEGGMVAVHYEYSPFGAITLNTNPIFDNKFSFSSEYSDVEFGLVYYNYRHYNSMDGRWISRDPIEEKGGFNLYSSVENRIINVTDSLGLKKCKKKCVFKGKDGANVTIFALGSFYTKSSKGPYRLQQLIRTVTRSGSGTSRLTIADDITVQESLFKQTMDKKPFDFILMAELQTHEAFEVDNCGKVTMQPNLLPPYKFEVYVTLTTTQGEQPYSPGRETLEVTISSPNQTTMVTLDNEKNLEVECKDEE